ncbi:MAG: hypothetical protein K6G26_12885 [Lachnospiraceae bacterium]|nr:hypothetical protein [Lachnospiraceae bacterium]
MNAIKQLNYKKYRTYVEFFNILQVIFAIFPLFACIMYHHFDNDYALLYCIIFMLCPILYFIFYKTISNSLLYFLLHAFFIMLVLILPLDLFTKVLFCISLIIFTIFSFYKKNDIILPKPQTVGKTPAAAIILAYILSGKMNSRLLCNAILLSLIGYIIVYLYNNYLANTFIFCSTLNDESLDSFTYAKTRLNKMWRKFLTTITPVMLIFVILPQIKSFGILRKIFIKLLSLFIDFLNSLSSKKEYTPATYTQSPSAPTVQPGEHVPEVVPTKINIMPLLYILFIIITIALIASLYYAIKTFMKKREAVKKEYALPVEEEKIVKKTIETKKARTSIIKKSLGLAIRRIFHKTIKANIDERLNTRGSFTSEQLCDIAFDSCDKDTLYKMRNIYIKVRYSNDTITYNDYTDMKALEKIIKKEK